ncbi:MAG: hypothetical protein Q4D26_12265 [Clostridia bacterium]|nr:hypothetical protein [Clostridia bacterium]
MSDIRVAKVGNTILEWDESKAFKSTEEVQYVIDDIADGVRRSRAADAIINNQNDKNAD